MLALHASALYQTEVPGGHGIVTVEAECPQRVTSGITRAEHNESALPRAADIRADVAQGLRRAQLPTRWAPSTKYKS